VTIATEVAAARRGADAIPSAAAVVDDVRVVDDLPVGRAGPLERAVDRVPFLEKELFLLRRLVRRGDVCLDIGAAGGAHLFVMAQRAGAAGRVVGVEPRPGSARLLGLSAGLAGLRRRVRIHQVALAADAGTLELWIPIVPTRAHLPGTTADLGSAAAFAGLPHRRIQVATMRLDDLIATEGLTRLDVVKCDVEGAETAVFAGAPHMLRELRPIIVVEADDAHQRRYDARAQDVLDAVTTHDYRVHRYRRGQLEDVDGIVGGEDDYVLVPRERAAEVVDRMGSRART
jgi:FkbM family methyltransferase